jgi:TolB-like protein
LNADPEQNYFVDGMTDLPITDLGKIKALKVISRTSTMQYKEARKPLPEIARELKVNAVAEGSVLRVGERVRITVQLIEAATDRHVWAESSERDLRDILALQSEDDVFAVGGSRSRGGYRTRLCGVRLQRDYAPGGRNSDGAIEGQVCPADLYSHVVHSR